LQVLKQQLRTISDAIVRRHATDLQRSVDLRVAPDDERKTSHARLRALRDIVVEKCEAIGSSGQYVSTEIDFTTALLCSELEKGGSYDENRANGLLFAASSLGALWFIDSRLLDPREFFSPNDGRAGRVQGLMAVDLGARFEGASAVAQSRSQAIEHALRYALEEACSSSSLRLLSESVFPEERCDAMTHFMSAEQQLLQRAEIVPPALQALCLAGDLAFGMGRCARLLSRYCATDRTERRIEILSGILNGLASDAS
jgi:hypothetical protein